jgi:hypothetical protein
MFLRSAGVFYNMGLIRAFVNKKIPASGQPFFVDLRAGAYRVGCQQKRVARLAVRLKTVNNAGRSYMLS